MNERIKKLWEQAVFDKSNKDSDAMVQNFAELIVKECAKVARAQTLEKYPGMKSDYDGIVYVEEAIKKHFGVEE